nr:hypothetical protein [Marinicella sp. W31]MDC2879260.1 hypothetical protein [Marinicella sp. W31]
MAEAAIARLGADRSLLSERGVLKQILGDQIGAKVDFEQALAMPGPSAGETQLRLNLAATALATDEAELARQALAPLGDSDDIDVWLARGKALIAIADFPAATEALQQAEALAKTDRERADVAVVRLGLVLAEDGNRPARSALRTAEAEGVLAPLGPTETAYLAGRVGDRSLAYDAFSEADAKISLPAPNTLTPPMPHAGIIKMTLPLSG